MRWFRTPAACLMSVLLAVAAGVQALPSRVHADKSPPTCTEISVDLRISQNVDVAHLGTAMTYSARIDNTPATKCDLTGMSVDITTPDGVAHHVATDLTVRQGESSETYTVPYTVTAANVKSNWVVATASASGIVHSNIDQPASGSSSISALVKPGVTVSGAAFVGSSLDGEDRVAVAGAVTDAPEGSNIVVSINGSSGTTTTGADNTWVADVPWPSSSGSYGGNGTITVSYGIGNTASEPHYFNIYPLTILGGDDVNTTSHSPTIDGTSGFGGGTTITVSIGGAGTATAVTLADGSWSVTWPTSLPKGTYLVQASGSYDTASASDTQILTIPNTAPEAVPDSYTVNEDGSLTASVLGNDTDVDLDVLTATIADNPAHGAVTLNSDGSFTYTPTANYNGLDSFSYKANDGTTDSNAATVSITVSPVNDPPTANTDTYNIEEDSTLTVGAPGVLSNDSDVDSGLLTAVLVSNPGHGTVTLNSDGAFTYTPEPNYNGSDSFTYTANDGAADSSEATVTIAVAPVNDPPSAQGDTADVGKGGTRVIDVLQNDTDVDGDALTATNVTDPAHGTVTLNPDGTITYTPDPDFTGPDSFTYTANDGTVDSQPATVSITVNVINHPPTAQDDTAGVSEGGTLTVSAADGVLKNDTDPDGDALTAVKVTDPAHGTVTLNSDGSFTYKPDSDYSGSDSFTYKANDGTLDSQPATVSITVNHVNRPPTANDDGTYTVSKGSTLTVSAANGVLHNDTDPDGDALTAVKVTDPDHGTVTLNSNGSFTYKPDSGYSGSDSFTYKANDGALDSYPATVSITVKSPPIVVNRPPLARDDSYSTLRSATLSVNAGSGVLDNDSDPDGDEMTAVLVSAPTHGTVTLNADGSFTFQPQANFAGSATFTYKARDWSDPSNTATVTIAVIDPNRPPVAVADFYGTDEGVALKVSEPGLLLNDSDPDGNPLTARLVSSPANGTLTLNPNGSFTYTPAPHFSGDDAFTYKANDGTIDSQPATVTITVKPAEKPAQPRVEGTLRDALTKQPVSAAKVTLYWADTDLNRQQGHTPDALVDLSGLPSPGPNTMPQLTTNQGTVSWSVFPQGDYYVRAEKNGYRPADSRETGLIHVGTASVSFTLEMQPAHRRYIRGYPDGTFKPEQSITRAEIAAIFARIVQPTGVTLPPAPFNDVPADHWANTYIELVRQKGIMQGDPEGTFRPDDPITRAELATVIYRFKNLTTAQQSPFPDTVGHWATTAIDADYAAGLVSGYPDGTFRPQEFTNRAEAATMINRVLGRGPLTGRAQPTWPDVPFTHWASGHVEEASTSHSAERIVPGEEHYTGDTGDMTW